MLCLITTLGMKGFIYQLITHCILAMLPDIVLGSGDITVSQCPNLPGAHDLVGDVSSSFGEFGFAFLIMSRNYTRTLSLPFLLSPFYCLEW